MNRLTVLGLVVGLLTVPAAPSHAQEYAVGYSEEITIPCGFSWLATNTSHQYGQFRWLEYIVETSISAIPCWIGVYVEAWVPGVSGSGMRSEGMFTATARRQIPVPYYGRWQTSGNHSRAGIFFEVHLASTVSFAQVNPPENDARREMSCISMGGTWYGDWCDMPNTPIIIDTARDGYRLTSVEDGVLFDLDADGVPERVAWTMAGSDDAFLVMDRNGNGVIDDGSELFGNYTPLDANRTDATAVNGFEALKFLESSAYGVSEPNGTITARDAAFPRLMLWRDLNHNGISEPDELQPLSESGLVAISTDYKTSHKQDRHGNLFRERARGFWADGESTFIYDVSLKTARQ